MSFLPSHNGGGQGAREGGLHGDSSTGATRCIRLRHRAPARVHPKTVGRALARGSAPVPTRRQRKSLLDAYRTQAHQLLAEGVWNAQVIFRAAGAGLRGEAFDSAGLHSGEAGARPGRVTVRCETEPGRQLQSDWEGIRTVVGGGETDLHFCANTVGYSRRFISGALIARTPSTPTKG